MLGKKHTSETTRLYQLVQVLGLTKSIFQKNNVSKRDIPDWYRGAIAFVYPSLWEGFGLPILEAMACGCPVITSAGSGTEEVAGDAAILVDPSSTSQLADELEQCLSTHQQKLIDKGIVRAAKYSWRRTTSATSEIIGSLLST